LYRSSLIVAQGLALSLPTGYIWLTLWTNQVQGSGWIVLAVATLAWAWLAYRTWTVHATLTPDALVIRNALRTSRVLLIDIAAVRWQHGRRGLRVTERHPPSTVPASVRAAAQQGRHQDPGERYFITAIALGVLADESGVHCRADDAADAIAAAAGLPPLPRRVAGASPKDVRQGIPFAVVMFVVGIALSMMHHGSSGEMGIVLTICGASMLVRPLLAVVRRFVARRRT
jgi:hypothetical protein